MASEERPHGAHWFEPPRPLGELAAEVNGLLRAAEVQLALAETGTGGEIAQLLGPSDSLTQARLFADAGALAAALRVSGAKVEAFGAISAMVAAEAAADLIDTYEGGWGLVVLVPPGNCDEEAGVQRTEGHEPCGFVALGTSSTTIIQQGRPELIARTILELLAQQAQRHVRARPTT